MSFRKIWNTGIPLGVFAPYVFERALPMPIWEIQPLPTVDSWKITINRKEVGKLFILSIATDAKLRIEYRSRAVTIPRFFEVDYMSYIDRVIAIENIASLATHDRKRIVKHYSWEFELFFHDTDDVLKWLEQEFE